MHTFSSVNVDFNLSLCNLFGVPEKESSLTFISVKT